MVLFEIPYPTEYLLLKFLFLIKNPTMANKIPTTSITITKTQNPFIFSSGLG